MRIVRRDVLKEIEDAISIGGRDDTVVKIILTEYEWLQLKPVVEGSRIYSETPFMHYIKGKGLVDKYGVPMVFKFKGVKVEVE